MYDESTQSNTQKEVYREYKTHLSGGLNLFACIKIAEKIQPLYESDNITITDVILHIISDWAYDFENNQPRDIFPITSKGKNAIKYHKTLGEVNYNGNDSNIFYRVR